MEIKSSSCLNDACCDIFQKFGINGNTTFKVLEFKIDGRPLILKNNKQIFVNPKTNRPVVLKNKNYEANIKDVHKTLEMQRMKYRNDIEFPIKACFVAYEFHYGNKIMGDITNLYEAPNDAMQHVGILEDDKLIATTLPSCRVIDKKWEGSIIRIYVPDKLSHIVEEK